MKKSYVFAFPLVILLISIFNFQAMENLTEDFPKYDYIPSGPLVIDADEDFIFLGFPGNGSLDDPYIIENLSISTSETYGIHVSGTTKHFVIKNCNVRARSIGIVVLVPGYAINITDNICSNIEYDGIVVNSNGAWIINNTCESNGRYGIKTTGTDNKVLNNYCYGNGDAGLKIVNDAAIVVNNTCRGSNSGIYCYNVNDCIVENNTCGGSYGIRLEDSYNCTITDNVCYNSGTGINLDNVDGSICENNTCYDNTYGMSVWDSNTPIQYNLVYDNNRGIYVGSGANKVRYNIVFYNVEYGIYCKNGENSEIYQNTIVDNSRHGSVVSQGYDDGTNNHWYDDVNLKGNYWSDWSGSGLYFMDGVSTGYDPYPYWDNDQDGLDDGWEVRNGLNPYYSEDNLTDFDQDGLSNYEEFLYNTNPNSNDTDGDSLTDFEEIYTYGTNATNADSDYDSLPDKWELDNLLNPLIDDSSNDNDEDNLTNYEEYLYNTNPQTNDTDSDLLPDSWEVYTGTNPQNNDTYFDLDGDGLTNYEEYSIGTFANRTDSDNDGLNDSAEINIYFTDPLDEDSDDDTYSDGEEVEVGTDPNDENDYPIQVAEFELKSLGIILLVIASITSLVLLNHKTR